VRVFVTGATGFVGRAILVRLQGVGHSARILVRNPDSSHFRALFSDARLETHRGNILDPSTLQDALEGVDAVIHLVGIISECRANTFDNVHRLGTENIVQAAQEAGVQRLVHMSALGTRPNAVARYHQSKWAAEEIVRRSGLDWTIFRPSIIFGPGDGFVNLFARISRNSPVLPVMGDGQSRFQPVAVEDVAACFIGALNEPHSFGQTYDLCGTEIFTLNEIVDLILEVTGRKRLKLRLPWAVAWCQAAFLELLFPLLLRRAPPLNRDQLLMLQEDNVGNPKPAMELFRIEPFSFQVRIARYLRPEK
jgi:NADH dehydrogenase